MAYKYVNNKREVESFVVSSGDQALPAGGTTLKNASGAINLANGQLGIFSDDFNGTTAHNTALAAGETIANARQIKIYQGTADSATPGNSVYKYPLYPRPFAASDSIEGSSDIDVTKQDYVAPQHATWIMGDTGALATGGIVPANNTLYSLGISYRGRIIDELFNRRNTQTLITSVTTPNFTTLGIAATNLQQDWIVQNMVEQINLNSYAISSTRPRFQGNDPIVALGIDLTGTDGTAKAAVVAGLALPVITTGGVTKTLTLTAEMAASLQLALPAGSSVINVNTTTAGTATNGVATAIVFMALDRITVYDDKVPQVKIDFELGLRRGFDNVTVQHARTSYPNEGEGLGRQLDLYWKRTEGQRLYTLSHREDPIINFPSPVDVSTNYAKYTITHKDVYQMDTFNATYNPRKEIILVPTADATTIASLEAVLSPWLVSAGTKITT